MAYPLIMVDLCSSLKFIIVNNFATILHDEGTPRKKKNHVYQTGVMEFQNNQLFIDSRYILLTFYQPKKYPVNQ